MSIIISSLLLIIALHFLLKGIKAKQKDSKKTESIKYTLYEKLENKEEKNKKTEETVEKKDSESEETEIKENFNFRRDLLRSINMKDTVSASNTFIDDKNDANFQSNMMNVNKFYKKNIDDNDFVNKKPDHGKINSFSNISKSSEPKETWSYKDEFVMNGGELLNGITGYDNNTDDYFSIQDFSNSVSKNPSDLDDDMRMGMGNLSENNYLSK